MSNIYYNVLTELPPSKVITDVEFVGSACFADWSCDSKGYYRDLKDEQPGHFAILIDTFEKQYRWSHRRVLRNAVRWLQDHDIDAHLYTTKDCKKGTTPLKNDTPVITLSYKPDDNRLKIYHGLCFIRYFTTEFIKNKNNPLRRSSLTAYFNYIFEKEVDYVGHMPFVDSFVCTRYYGDPDDTPEYCSDLGTIYLTYLDTMYKERVWDRDNQKIMRPSKPQGWSFWTGGLRYDHWVTFYRNYRKAHEV